MKKFNQLSKAEMRKVNGGVPPVCNLDNSCAVNTPGGVLFGNCSTDIMGSCICSREFNNNIFYGDNWYCQSVS